MAKTGVLEKRSQEGCWNCGHVWEGPREDGGWGAAPCSRPWARVGRGINTVSTPPWLKLDLEPWKEG